VSESDPFVCVTCGAHDIGAPPPAGGEAGDGAPPEVCPICADPRQYVGEGGQRWLRHSQLARSHRTRVELVDDDLWGVGVEPSFGIGQRALLVRTSEGNVLWDCVPLVDASGVTLLEALGGVRTIAVSHPHFYTGVALWAEALGAEVLLHAADREHLQVTNARVRHWDGERLALPGRLMLVRAGGHFAGSTVLHWLAGAGGRGALLTGDTVQVIPDRGHVGFMWSYPNLIPLPAREVERVAAALAPLAFDRLHGGWWGRVIETDAHEIVQRSARRYVRALEERLDGEWVPPLESASAPMG
jgi:hypothetical protein